METSGVTVGGPSPGIFVGKVLHRLRFDKVRSTEKCGKILDFLEKSSENPP
jgi:hypothetical protein